MIVLNRLYHERRVTSDQVAADIQRPVGEARGVLERLMEEGLVEARGERRGRVYHLAAQMYEAVGQPEAYVRVHGLDPIRQEAAVLQFVQAHSRIRRDNVMELCNLTGAQAHAAAASAYPGGEVGPEGRAAVELLRGRRRSKGSGPMNAYERL